MIIASINLGEPPTVWEPQSLNKSISEEKLLSKLKIISIRIVPKSSNLSAVCSFKSEDELRFGESRVLLVKAKKKMYDKPKKLAYLSGSPRVSTRSEAGACGLRSHVLGVIRAFERLGWNVRSFIVGDRVPLQWGQGEHSIIVLRRSWFGRTRGDFVRLGMGWLNSWRAWKEMGLVNWACERYGAFQALGWLFQQNGVPWIIETNEIYFLNAAKDRRVSALNKVAQIA